MQCLLIRQASQMSEEAILLIVDGRVLLVGTDHVLALPPQCIHRVQLRRPFRQPQQRHPLGLAQGSLGRRARSLSEYSPVFPDPPLVSLGLGRLGPDPNLRAHCPPQLIAARLLRRQIFRRLGVRQISCHSAETFSRPRRRNRRMPRADLIRPKTGSTICLRAAYRALPGVERSLACIFSLTLASAAVAAPAGVVAAAAGTGASWCFWRPRAMCGSRPISSNTPTAFAL